MPTYFLNLREVYTPFQLPTLPELLQSLKAKFSDDPGMIVLQPRRSEQGMYRIVLEKDEDNLQLPLSVGGQTFTFPLRKLTDTEAEGKFNLNPRAEGQLYTLYHCTTGALGRMSNKHFDAALSALGRITRPCEHQRYKGQTVFNGNRFFCMVAKGPVPDSVEIRDPSHPEEVYYVKIGYKGKKYYCARCQESHVGECPVKKTFYAEQEYRATTTISTMLLADSTLRQAEATGLSSDIFCMSGGRVGHVAHLIQDAPKMDQMKEIVVVAGANDVYKASESVDEFTTRVEKGVENCRHAVYPKGQHLTIVPSPLQADLTPLEQLKRDRLDFLLQKLSTTPENKFSYLPCPSGIQMEGRHPTEAGTKALLEYINATLGIIHNRAFITSTRLYDGVQSAYRYGCLGCLNHLHLNRESYCSGCAALVGPNSASLTTKGDTEPDSPLEVHMSETDHKRLTTPHDDSTPSKLVKTHDDSNS